MIKYKRKEVIGNATLYLADCREILPELHADVLLTDPVWPNCPEGLLPGSNNPKKLFKEAIKALNPVKRMIIVMRGDSDPRFLSVIPEKYPFFRCQYLPYALPAYIGRKLGGDEIAYTFGEPIPSSPGKHLIPGYGPKAQPHNRLPNGHPCSRPLIHTKWLIEWWTLPDETIIDPFMGSGTSIVAAVAAGRKAIGVETKEEYFDLACKYTEQAQKQSLLFIS